MFDVTKTVQDPGLTALVVLMSYHGVAAETSQIEHRFGRRAIGIPEMLRCAKDFKLVGHLLSSGSWERLVIPAIATEPRSYPIGATTFYDRAAGEVLDPSREPQEVLDEMRLAIGSMQYSAQYMQDPVPPGGNVIRREWLKFFREEPEEIDFFVASWDTASTLSETSSFSVGMLWGAVGTDYYLLDVIRGRWEFHDLRRRIIGSIRVWQPDATLIEGT